MDGNLSNADAAMAIGAFLRRLRRKGRNPDHYEAEEVIRALTFLACDRYQQAIDRVGRAVLLPSKRDPAAVAEVERAGSHLAVPTVAALEVILEEICDGGQAYGCLFDGLAPNDLMAVTTSRVDKG